jgi:hypothetical protein
MDWLWFNQCPNLQPWTARPFSPGVELGPGPGDRGDNHERIVVVEEPGPPLADGPFRRLARAIFAFDIFPPRVAFGVLQRSPIEIGDCAGVCYRLIPGCRLFFAARVYERFDDQHGETWRAGFSYHTLVGHPMCGEETFCVEKNLTTGQILVALRSWSRPVHWSTRWGNPIARRQQLQAGRSALDHLQSIAESPQLLANARERVC